MPRPDEEDLFKNTTMTFGEHLEELRTCLFRSLFGLALAFLASLYFAPDVVRFIEEPLKKALTTFYQQQTVNKVADRLQELREAGYTLPSNTEKIEAFVAKKGLTPEEAYVNPGEFLRALKKADSEQFRDARLPADEEEAGLMGDELVQVFIWRPLERDVRVTNLGPHEPFTIFIKAAVVLALVVSSPWIFYQIWSFVAAGLYPHEKKYIHVFLPFSLGLFLAGAALAFFFVFEPVLKFLFMFNDMMGITPDLRISEWLSFVLILPLGFGISFQLPLVMLFLERIRVFDVHAYLTKWRVAVLVIAVIAMLLTPADPTSMLLMGIPLTFLYFGGILLCKWFPRRRSPFDGDVEEEKKAEETEKKSLTPQAKRERFWFIVRLVAVAILLVLVFTWRPMQEARQQKAVVDDIETLGGKVYYDYQFDEAGELDKEAQPSGWGPLRKLLGKDLFNTVVEVDLSGTEATDAVVDSLIGLPDLERLDLKGTKLTKQGVKRLSQELPDCKIVGP